MLTKRDRELLAPETIIKEVITKVDGEVAYKQYLLKDFLGKGAFAKCYSVSNLQTHKLSAAKIVDKEGLSKNRTKQKLLAEIRIHKALRHPNVVGFQSCFEDSKNVYILLELCPNKTLSQYLKGKGKLQPQEVRGFMHQLLTAVKYIHSNKIIHRDLKLGNIFLGSQNQVKVGDFGLSTKLEFSDERKRTICGTPNYIAPEVVEGAVGHSYEVDTWACGVICYALLFGRPPFETNHAKTTYAKIKSGKYDFPNTVVPEEAKDFIKRTLQLDPKKRLTIPEMLQHPFIKTVTNFKTSLSDSTRESATGTIFEAYKNQDDLMGLINSPRNSCKAPINTPHPDVYLVKYVDYSSKYGLGYILSNGDFGVYFNDSSKMTLRPHIDQLVFIPSKGEDQSAMVISKASEVGTGNKELSKKFYLMEHFRFYLQAELKEKQIDVISDKNAEQGKPVFVKQWLKTKHATMFRLSNGAFQVNFLDSTQLILNSRTRTVSFTNKRTHKQTMPLAQALSSSCTELTRRIRYTKDILHSLRRPRVDQASCEAG